MIKYWSNYVNGNWVSIPIIFDDSMYAHRTTTVYTGRPGTYEEAISAFNEFFGVDSSSIKFPVFFWENFAGGLAENLIGCFPSFYLPINNIENGQNIIVGKVDTGILTTVTFSNSYYRGCTFPFRTDFSGSSLAEQNQYDFSDTILVFPESSYSNDKIIGSVTPKTLHIRIGSSGFKSLSYGYTASQNVIDVVKIGTLSDVPENPGPYEPGGTTDTGGGDGSFDNTSTPIDIPGLPSISASSTGFISLFNPSLAQLNELASYLWSDLFEIDGWKKLFADPMDAILGLSILPVEIPSTGTREVKVGNIGTGISLNIASNQFVEVDCGSINVNEYWGAYLDYEPYTQAQIFLPYIGTRPISVDEIMGKTVRVVYHVDILTGACCCFVKCGDSVLYTYNGQCSIPIPITGANYTSVVNGVISIAASVGSLVATGGASAPTAIPAIASAAVNQMKPSIEKSGSISGSAGILNMQTPYLILIRPRQALPSKQNEFIGYPSLITVQLTELSGYTEVQSIHLENIPATQEELAEIQSLLEGGVIF